MSYMMLYLFQKEEKVFEDKISQVVQLTGKTKDEVVIALYDCDNDPNRAVNMLLEGDDQVSGGSGRGNLTSVPT